MHAPLGSPVHMCTPPQISISAQDWHQSPTSPDSWVSDPLQPFPYMYSPGNEVLPTATFVHMQTRHFFTILSQILYHFPQDKLVLSIAQTLYNHSSYTLEIPRPPSASCPHPVLIDALISCISQT